MSTNFCHSVPKTRGLKTPEQVRREFARKGLTVSGWARQHGVSHWTVFAVLKGRNRGHWGEGHKVAVLLGLKDGEIDGEVAA